MQKFIVSLATIIGASSVLLAAGPNNPANFENAKARMSEMADKRISIIKEFKACVGAAKDNAALKECRHKEGEAMKEARPKGGMNEPQPRMDPPPPPPPANTKPGM